MINISFRFYLFPLWSVPIILVFRSLALLHFSSLFLPLLTVFFPLCSRLSVSIGNHLGRFVLRSSRIALHCIVSHRSSIHRCTQFDFRCLYVIVASLLLTFPIGNRFIRRRLGRILRKCAPRQARSQLHLRPRACLIVLGQFGTKCALDIQSVPLLFTATDDRQLCCLRKAIARTTAA